LTLTTGSRIGPYEIAAQIGQGGMGEVYRARDTKLDRDVALKILPQSFASDPDRLMRFEREAKTLASLNHPNIAHIHGFEEAGVVRALVMELVEGDDLSTHIGRGPMALAEALSIARQISDALEAAHERGIIHRDLKPANVKVRADGTVKVLDFGLAKILTPDSGLGTLDNGSSASTLTSPAMTAMGLILGTAAYMSPEQAKGGPVDKRADIWAFGVVLFEMLSGRRLFRGDSVVETIGLVATRDPDWTTLPASTPAGVRQLLARCLRRDPKHRLRDIGEARIALAEADTMSAPDLTAALPVSNSTTRVRTMAVALVFVALVAASGWYLYFGTRRSGTVGIPSPFHAEIVPTPADAFGRQSTTRVFTYTPDGRTLIYASTDPAARKLYRRDRDADVAVPIAGTDGAYGPFVSPNGTAIGFLTDGRMMRVPVGGGTAQLVRDFRAASAADRDRVGLGWVAELGPSQEIVYGATWLQDDTIVYGRFTGGLWRIGADGGTPTPLTTVSRDREIGHRLPQALPGGRAILCTVVRDLISRQGSTIEAVELSTGARTKLVDDGTDGRYVPGGYLLFARNGAVYAVRFDPETLETSGEPAKVIDRVMHAIGGGSPARASGVAQFDVSSDGIVAVLPGGMITSAPRILVWVSAGGKPEPLPVPAGGFLGPRLSPDESRIVARNAPEISIIGVKDGIATPLLKDGLFPVWHPDMSKVYVAWRKTTRQEIYSVPLAGGAPSLVASSESLLWPSSVSRDGKFLAYVESNATTGNDIWVVDLSPAGAPTAIVATPANEAYPAFSPDGKWLVYTAGEGATSEIYVRPFPGPGRPERISRDGGTAPVWSHDGRTILYGRMSDAQATLRDIVRVPIDVTGDRVISGTPSVFASGAFSWSTPVAGFDVTKDGKRILTNVTVAPTPGAPGSPSVGRTLQLIFHANLAGRRDR
jgi:serine/threonine protein kinase